VEPAASTILAVIAAALSALVVAFFIAMWVRFVLDWIRALQPGWRPRGLGLLVAEGVYTVTDPPIRLVRRLVPPLRFGAVRLDLAWSIVLVLCLVVLSLLGAMR